MSQVSYGTITITDTNDIESIYMIYKGGDNNETPPSITWTEGRVDWTTDITTVEGNYIWAITVYKKSGITITADNYQEFFGDPVCLTGSAGRSVRSINTYYCNYGEGRPDETYNGWSGAVPEYDENKPNYWVKTVITYVDSTEEVIEASGAIASFNTEDKETSFRSLIADIEPIQDLHGYDKPWAGGAGKNLVPNKSPNVPVSYAGVTMTIDGNDFVFNGTSTGTGGRLVFMTESFSLKSGTYFISVSLSGSGDVYPVLHNANGNVVVKQGAGVVTIAEDINAFIGFNVSGTIGTTFDLKVKCQLESGSTASAWTPYSNICPISGHTEVVTHRTGVNVWDEEWEEGTINTNGDNSSSTTRWRTKNYISIKPNTQYYFKGTKTGSGTASIRPRFYDANKVYIGNTSQSGTDIVANTVFTTPTNAYYMRFTPDKSGTYGILTDEVTINYPSTDTDYHAYQGTTYTTDLGRTVYGGTLDVVSGELVIDRAMVDLGDVTWNYNSTYSCWVTTAIASVVKKYPTQAEMITAIAEKYVVDPVGILNGANFTAGKFILGTSGNLFVKTGSDSETPTGAFVYELATPQTIQLTPTEVRTLLGTNNVWSDGEVSVSVFTTVGQDITIYRDNAITKAIHDSVESNAKATEALDKATAAEQLVTQVDTLLGGHFLWHGSALSTLTKAGARVVEQVTSGTTDVSGNPSQWLHNVNIGANGIQLRYNEAVMAQLAATNSSSSNDIALKFYQPPTISGSTTTQGNLTMALRGNALTFYDPTVANGQSVQATLDANGLKLLKGGVEAGTKNTNDYIYVYSTDDATNHTFNINSSGNKSDWRIVAGQNFGVDKAGNLYANNATISGTMTIGANSTINGTNASTVVNNASTGAGAAADLATYKTTVSNTYATQEALSDVEEQIPDVSGLASKSAAIAEEQLIYIQATSGTNSVSAYPSSSTTTSSYWVTQTGESIPNGTPPDGVIGQTPRWTIKRPSYQKNYPVIFVAKQKKTVSGEITCSTPIKDDTITIIDGGHITTGTIDASRLSVYDATINKISASAIDVSSIQIGQSQVNNLTTDLGNKASVSAEYSVDIVTSNFDPTATGTDTFITLTAKVSRVDGTAVGTISYAWYGDNSNTAISGATSASYNVPANLVWNGTSGYKTFTVQVN